MTIALEAIGGASVFTPGSRVDGSNAAALEAALLPASEAAGARVVLDLSQVEYISSAGLRVVVLVSKRLKQRGGKLVLCGLQPLVHEVFEISGLIGLIAVASDRSAALTA